MPDAAAQDAVRGVELAPGAPPASAPYAVALDAPQAVPVLPPDVPEPAGSLDEPVSRASPLAYSERDVFPVPDVPEPQAVLPGVPA